MTSPAPTPPHPEELPPIATCSFKAFRPGMGVPVRTSTGAYRWFKHGTPEYVKALAPWGIFKNPAYEDPDDWERAYRARCDDLADEIVAGLVTIGRAHPGETLVLLCYEDVHTGARCHRRYFAEWAAAHLGVEIPEISPVGADKHKAPGKTAPTLF